MVINMAHNVINLAERRQQRMHARHGIGQSAATLRAIDYEAIEEAACQARARAYEAQEAQAMVESEQLRATMDTLIARSNPYTKP